MPLQIVQFRDQFRRSPKNHEPAQAYPKGTISSRNSIGPTTALAGQPNDFEGGNAQTSGG